MIRILSSRVSSLSSRQTLMEYREKFHLSGGTLSGSLAQAFAGEEYLAIPQIL